MKDSLFDKEAVIRKVIILFTLMLLIFISYTDYLLFHLMVESATAIIGYVMIIIIINTRGFSENNLYIFLGIAYAFIGSIDLMHAVVYRGMNIINVKTANTATQLWIIARYVQSISLLIVIKYRKKVFNYTKVLGVYFTIFVYSIAVIFNEKIFPKCYIDGVGLTKFKIFSEYLIIMILLYSIYLLKRDDCKQNFIVEKNKNLILSLSLAIISELCFTLYINVYGIFNMLGHMFKLSSLHYVYISLIKINLKEPYKIIFNDLNKSLEDLKHVNNELNLKNNELQEIRIRLQNNLKKYKKFSEVLPFAVIIREHDDIVYINKKAQELLKLENESEVIGKSLYEIVNDKSKGIVKNRIAIEYVEKVCKPVKEQFLRSDGSVVDVEVAVTSISLDNKEYFMGVLNDVTHIKKLCAIEKKLEEKQEYEILRNEFFANISHELRTPINVIYSALQLDDIYFSNKDYTAIKRNRGIIKQNCMRLLRLINNLIDITKIDAGFFNPNMECLNIVEVVESIVDSVVSYVENKKMNIIFDTEMEEIYINCDPNLIERIMLNLISNSIKYGRQGGNIYIDICSDSNKIIFIKIKDDGIGIPEDKQKIVFQRFIRVDESLARNCEGSGIGLSLVKSLVEIQNGSINLKSKEGVGTEFIIGFPLAEINKEVCMTSEESINANNIIKNVDLEFSDIY